MWELPWQIWAMTGATVFFLLVIGGLHIALHRATSRNREQKRQLRIFLELGKEQEGHDPN